jgi:phage major head subunit gpT-like protein
MRSSQWAEALLPGIYKWFDVGLRLRPSLIPLLYNVQTSGRAAEDHDGIGGMSPDAWEAYEATGQKAEQDFSQLYPTQFVHREKPVTLTIERKLIDDDQYGIIAQRARKLGISAFQRMEIDAASVFNRAFLDTYPGPDGVGLASLAHPDGPGLAGTQANEGTLELNATNVGLTRTAMSKFKDDKGNPIQATGTLLLVPPDLDSAANIAVFSKQDPESANNAINPEAGKWSVVPWHYLTDANAWFVIDPVWMKESLFWYNRAPLEFMIVDETTTEIKLEAYMRYSFGFVDWRWIYGQNPS